MNSNEQDINPGESLRVITSMIETAKHSICDQSAFYLLWGWAVMIGCLTQFFLLVIEYPHHYYAWFITLVALPFHLYLMAKQGRKETVKTYIGEANKYLWSGLAFAFVVLNFIFFKIGWQYCYPFYILFYGIGTYVSGNLLKFKPFVVGGVACIIIAAFTAYLPFKLQILMMGFAILISYVIPGHMLRLSYQKKQIV